jgi:superfamily I DNA/RNA helicase
MSAARIAITTNFLEAYTALQGSEQRLVKNAFAKFDDLRHAGGHIEKLGGKNPNVKSLRVNQELRIILLAPESGDLYVWHTVMHHDAAYDWAARHRFQANAATGAFEVVDFATLDAMQTNLAAAPATPTAPPVFAVVSDADLIRLGIDSDRLPLVRLVTTEEQVLSLVGALPPQQAEVLCMLFDGLSVEETWAAVAALAAPTSARDDLQAAALSPASADRVHLVEGPDEFEWILSQPFDKWRTFLHHSQRRLAYRSAYNGPVRVTGGAGTGKTVVALHRVKALLDNGHQGRVLFTTYNRNLASDIEQRLSQLVTPEQMKQVDVINIDRLIMSIVRDHLGKAPAVLAEWDAKKLWETAVLETGFTRPWEFVAEEWDRVVAALGITSREQYLAAPRAGRGTRLNRAERIAVWQVIEAFGRAASHAGKYTFPQLSMEATTIMQAQAVRPYTAVVVDEAQDLHPATWRAVRELVSPGQNDLFIVGDAHQRIYGPKASLKRCGIDIVGRSHKLRINYRTTLQILRWSRALLSGMTVDDLDEGADDMAGYTSLLQGAAPSLAGFRSSDDEIRHITDWINQRRRGSDSYSSFCVVARTNDEVGRLLAGFGKAKLPAEELSATSQPTENAVHVGTMHRVKGLEYRYMVVAGVSAGVMPPNFVSQRRHDSPEEYDRLIEIERSLLFVSSTRARDEVLVTWVGSPSPLLPGQ